MSSIVTCSSLTGPPGVPAAKDTRNGTLRRVKSRAGAVVIGGGVGGCSIAYHLAKLGLQDVVLVEQFDLTYGSTWHSAGLVGQLRSSVSLTRMMMYSVELYAALRRETGKDPGLARARRHPPRLVAGAARGDPAPGRLGEDVRPAARDHQRGRGAGALPADVDRRRARRGLPAARRLPRPEPADVRAGRRRAPLRRRDQHAHARDRDRARRARPRLPRRHRQGRDRDRGRRQRRGHGRTRRRAARRRDRADHPDGAPVPDHRAVRPGARAAADAARPRQPRLLAHRGRRARDGRLRAQSGAVRARRHSARASRRSS